jgi:hypothetical protein
MMELQAGLWEQSISVCSRDSLRDSTKQVLTSGHAGCTFTVHRKRTGAIPNAEGQQNADGSGVKPGLVGVQLCRRPLEQGYLPGLCWSPAVSRPG